MNYEYINPCAAATRRSTNLNRVKKLTKKALSPFKGDECSEAKLNGTEGVWLYP